MTNEEATIQALLVERAGYVQRNLPARVKAVDQALEALGYKKESRETASIQPTENASVAHAKRKRVADRGDN